MAPRALAAMLSVVLHLLVVSVLVRVATGSIDTAPPLEHEATADKLIATLHA